MQREVLFSEVSINATSQMGRIFTSDSLLDLDDSILKYWPSFSMRSPWPGSTIEQITFRQVIGTFVPPLLSLFLPFLLSLHSLNNVLCSLPNSLLHIWQAFLGSVLACHGAKTHVPFLPSKCCIACKKSGSFCTQMNGPIIPI